MRSASHPAFGAEDYVFNRRQCSPNRVRIVVLHADGQKSPGIYFALVTPSNRLKGMPGGLLPQGNFPAALGRWVESGTLIPKPDEPHSALVALQNLFDQGLRQRAARA